MDGVAVAVAKHLDFDVAGALHVFFDQHRVVAKTAACLALTRRQGFGKVCFALDDAHALATAACAGFDEHRKTDALGFTGQQSGVLVCAVVARHQRHTGFFHQLFRGRFQSHGLDGRRGWPNEHHTRLQAGVGEVGVFTQKPIARVDGLGAGLHGGLQDALPLQIAVLRRVAADVHRLIAGLHMGRVGVGVREHRHGAHTHAAGSRGDAAGDFASVGDQDLAEHRGNRHGGVSMNHQGVTGLAAAKPKV